MDQSEKADVLFAPTEQTGKGSTRRLQCGHLYKSLVRFLTLPACGHITLSICDTKTAECLGSVPQKTQRENTAR